jgi:hypothetical protein
MTATPLNTRTFRIDPRKIRLLELNAHYMRHETFARLVSNLRADGGLHGDNPLCWRLHDDATQTPITGDDGAPVYEVLSGNHRVKAAIAAGLTEIEVVAIDDYLPPSRRKAIQLSRNAVTGEDDPAILSQIYTSIDDFDLRLYSGLDDKMLKLLDEVDVSALSEAALDFQTITLTFLPHELEGVAAILDRARKSAPSKGYWLARWADYDRAMDALELAGQSYGVKNTATTLMLILDVFARHITDLQEGYLDAEGAAVDPKRKVPTATLLGADTLPAGVAAKLKRALDHASKALPTVKDRKPSIFGALEAVVDTYLSAQSDAKKSENQ